MNIVNTVNTWLNKVLIGIAGLFLVGMMLLTCANIVCRTVWIPIQGTVELMGFFGAIVAAFALSDTQRKHGHIAVDILVNTFPAWFRRIVRVINNAICLVFFMIIAWQVAKKAMILWHSGEVTETLHIIYYPFLYAVAFACVVATFVFLTELIKIVMPPADMKQSHI